MASSEQPLAVRREESIVASTARDATKSRSAAVILIRELTVAAVEARKKAAAKALRFLPLEVCASRHASNDAVERWN